jgi:ParB family chromosome partitioning protein
VVGALVETMGNPANLISPILVRPHPDHPGRFALVFGAHRLEARAKRGDTHILADIRSMTDVEAQIQEIRENYDRADLTALQRSKDRADLVRLTEQRVSNVGHPSGGAQPHDKGISKVATDIGVSRQQIHRDIKIASITPEAQAAATEAGLANNQSALLTIAEQPPDKQVHKVSKIAAEPKRKRRSSEEVAAEKARKAEAEEEKRKAEEKAQKEREKVLEEEAARQADAEEHEQEQQEDISHAMPTRGRMSRPKRWADWCGRAEQALQELEDLRSEYEQWRDSLPDNLQSGALADKLEDVVGLDIQSAIELVQQCCDVELPRGFGRD